MSEARRDTEEPAAAYDLGPGRASGRDDPDYSPDVDPAAGSRDHWDRRAFADDAYEASERESPIDAETAHPGGTGRGPLLRNFLVATATIPFVFLLVLIASIFVLDAPPNRAPAAVLEVEALETDAIKLTVDDRPEPPLALTGAPAPAAGRIAAEGLTSLAAEDFAIEIPRGAEVRSVGLDGERLALLVDGPNGRRIIVYDVSRGEPLTSLPIVLEGAAVGLASSGDAGGAVDQGVGRGALSGQDRGAEAQADATSDIAVASRDYEITLSADYPIRAPMLKGVAVTIAEARAELAQQPDVAPQPTDVDGF